MALWGNRELVSGANSGTIELSNTTSGEIVGTGTDFLVDVSAGDFIRANDTLYVVTAVTNATSLTVAAGYLGDDIAAIGAGNTYVIAEAPLYNAYTDGVVNNERTAVEGHSGTSEVYFVDATEVGVASNAAEGLDTHAGWVKYQTYTDSEGNTRHKSEVLVAMGTSAADAGDAEDTVVADS